MYQDLDLFRIMLSYMKTCAVSFYVFIGVGVCRCYHLFRRNLIGMLVCEVCKSQPISTSAIDAITFFCILFILGHLMSVNYCFLVGD